MTPTTEVPASGALTPLVDALVATPLDRLSVADLQGRYAALVPQPARLTGWLGTVQAELHARTGGQVPTEDGGTRSLAGWVAEADRGTASAAGRQVRTASDLRDRLPGVADAALDGRVTPGQRPCWPG